MRLLQSEITALPPPPRTSSSYPPSARAAVITAREKSTAHPPHAFSASRPLTAATESSSESWTALAETLMNKPSAETVALLALSHVRAVDVREGKTLNLSCSVNQETALLHSRRMTAKKPCNHCAWGEGSFTSYIDLQGHCRDACASCHYSSMGSHCFYHLSNRTTNPKEKEKEAEEKKKEKMKKEAEVKKRKKKKKKEKKEKKEKKPTAVVKQNLSPRKRPAAAVTALARPAKHHVRDNSVELLDAKEVEIECLRRENTSLQGKLNHVQCLLKMAVEFIKDD
ncbi:hypothetical protein RJ035_006315 [Blastomyces gilchristii]